MTSEEHKLLTNEDPVAQPAHQKSSRFATLAGVTAAVLGTATLTRSWSVRQAPASSPVDSLIELVIADGTMRPCAGLMTWTVGGNTETYGNNGPWKLGDEFIFGHYLNAGGFVMVKVDAQGNNPVCKEVGVGPTVGELTVESSAADVQNIWQSATVANSATCSVNVVMCPSDSCGGTYSTMTGEAISALEPASMASGLSGHLQGGDFIGPWMVNPDAGKSNELIFGTWSATGTALNAGRYRMVSVDKSTGKVMARKENTVNLAVDRTEAQFATLIATQWAAGAAIPPVDAKDTIIWDQCLMGPRTRLSFTAQTRAQNPTVDAPTPAQIKSALTTALTNNGVPVGASTVLVHPVQRDVANAATTQPTDVFAVIQPPACGVDVAKVQSDFEAEMAKQQLNAPLSTKNWLKLSSSVSTPTWSALSAGGCWNAPSNTAATRMTPDIPIAINTRDKCAMECQKRMGCGFFNFLQGRAAGSNANQGGPCHLYAATCSKDPTGAIAAGQLYTLNRNAADCPALTLAAAPATPAATVAVTPAPTVAGGGGARGATIESCTVAVPVRFHSHRLEQISHAEDRLEMTAELSQTEEWQLEQAVVNSYDFREYYIKTDDGMYLAESQQQLILSNRKDSWAIWHVMDAGAGRVFLKSFGGLYIKDFDGNLQLQKVVDPRAKWLVQTNVNANACDFQGAARVPTFFCFAVMRAWGSDQELMKLHRQEGTGVYTCNEWMVLSGRRVNLAAAGQPASWTTRVDHAKIYSTEHAQYPNHDLYMAAWMGIKGKYYGFDWTVKVDPDTMFMADRLASRLGGASFARTTGVFFANCWANEDVQKQDQGRTHNGIFLYGAIEVFSRKAVRRYFDEAGECQAQIRFDDGGWWEERYMTTCLHRAGIPLNPWLSNDLQLLSDPHCVPNLDDPDCSGDAVAMHPINTTAKYQTCRQQILNKQR